MNAPVSRQDDATSNGGLHLAMLEHLQWANVYIYRGFSLRIAGPFSIGVSLGESSTRSPTLKFYFSRSPDLEAKKTQIGAKNGLCNPLKKLVIALYHRSRAVRAANVLQRSTYLTTRCDGRTPGPPLQTISGQPKDTLRRRARF